MTVEFRNNSDLDFSDISSEEWREYDFGDGDIVRIDKPLKINVGDNGYRVLDGYGISHFVPNT